jgi:pentatricopeptide repeat protein
MECHQDFLGLELLKELQEKFPKFKLYEPTYLRVMFAYGNIGNASAVQKYFDNVPVKTYEMYLILLKAYAKAKHMEKLTEVFGQMLRQGFEINIKPFALLIGAYGSVGNVEQAIQIANLMENEPYSFKPDRRLSCYIKAIQTYPERNFDFFNDTAEYIALIEGRTTNVEELIKFYDLD